MNTFKSKPMLRWVLSPTSNPPKVEQVEVYHMKTSMESWYESANYSIPDPYFMCKSRVVLLRRIKAAVKQEIKRLQKQTSLLKKELKELR
jgi:hypothetical protein